MGKQNFLQGGFKGKVGAFVGKSWKDILVIQSAPTVNNPRTEKQQKMRAGFARRVEACKLAMQANYNASFWESTSNTKWALMMSSSSQMYSDTKNILQYTPLIPYGYSPAYVTSEDPTTSGQNVVLSFDTTDDISGRAMSVLLYVKETATDTYTAQLVTASVAGSSGAWTVTARIPNGYEVGDDSYITAVSRDDTQYEDTCLYQPPFAIGGVVPTVTFTLTASNTVSWTQYTNSVTFSFTPSETIEDASNITAAESNSGVLQGSFTSESGNATISVIGGVVYATVPVTLDSLGQRPLFVSGSSVNVGAFTFEGEEATYIFEGGTFNIAETPTTQTLALLSTVATYAGNNYIVKISNANLSPSTSMSGSASVTTLLDDFSIDTLTYSPTWNNSTEGTSIYFDNINPIRNGNGGTYTFPSAYTCFADGVTYQIPQNTAITLRPYETSATYTFDFSELSSYSNTVSSSGDYRGFVYPAVQFNTSSSTTLNALSPDSYTVSQSGATIMGSSLPFFTTTTSGYSPFMQNDGGFSQVGTGDVTLSVTYNSNKSANISLSNLDGFVIRFVIPAGTYSFTGSSN